MIFAIIQVAAASPLHVMVLAVNDVPVIAKSLNVMVLAVDDNAVCKCRCSGNQYAK